LRAAGRRETVGLSSTETAALANIVVFVELREGHPTGPALFALREARRVANALGATVYALVAAGALDARAIDALPGPLGASGADKVLLCVGPGLAGPPLDPVYAGLLDQVWKTLRPRLFAWPAGNLGLQLGPALAVRTEAVFFPRAVLELGDPTRPEAPPALVARRWGAELDGQWTLTLTGGHANAVVTLAAGSAPMSMSTSGETELQLLSPPAASAAAIDLLETTADSDAAIELASVLIVAGGAERERTAAELRGRATPEAAVLAELPAAAIADACPAHIVIVGGKPYPVGLSAVRATPAAQVILVGKRAQVPSPLVSALWQVDRAQALTAPGGTPAGGASEAGS
jgi:electron transfer flavoprotein alpha subunit